jgi:hypothetical protein
LGTTSVFGKKNPVSRWPVAGPTTVATGLTERGPQTEQGLTT